MPLAPKVCAHPGCGNTQGQCADHDRKPWAGSNRRAQLPKGWSSRIVPAVLERDPVCTICNMAVATEVHHTGDRHDHRMDALAGVCHDCHTTETARQSRLARVQ